MKDVEIIENSIVELGRINVPAEYTESIAIPLYNVRQDLIALHQAIQQQIKKAKTAEQEPSDDGVTLRIVKEEPSDEERQNERTSGGLQPEQEYGEGGEFIPV